MSLTELSYAVRKSAPFAILGVIILFIVYYSIQLFFLILDVNRPTEEEQEVLAIDTVFDQIPEPIILESTPSGQFSYTLDTIEGVPLTAGETSEVFFLPEFPATFGFRENIYLMAKTLGIKTEIVTYRLNGNIATFTDDEQKLEVDITNYNFDYEYNLLSQEQEALNNAQIPSEDNILTVATDVLKNVGRYPGELARGKTNIIYLAFNPETEQLTVVESPEAANLVEVDFYRSDIGDTPIVAPRYYNSQNYVILLFNERNDYRVIRAKIQFYETSEGQVGVYPLKNGEQAWTALNEGRGKVVSVAEGVENVSIKNMYLGYLDPDIYQPYLQPVYVFLGDNNFAAYVPAITDEWLTEASGAAEIVFNDQDATGEADALEDPEEDTEATSSAEEEQDEAVQEPTVEVGTIEEQKARDEERAREMNAIRVILRDYLEENGSFPAGLCTPESPCISDTVAEEICSADNWMGLDLCDYGSRLPVDPLNGELAPCLSGSTQRNACRMVYRVALNGTEYEVNGRFEIVDTYSITVENDGGNSDEWVELFSDGGELLGD